MSDFPLSLEDIDLLINRKIPLIISQNRPSRAAYHVLYRFYFGDPPGQSETESFFPGHHFTQLYNFILAIHRGNPKLLVHWSRFHADLLFFLSKR